MLLQLELSRRRKQYNSNWCFQLFSNKSKSKSTLPRNYHILRVLLSDEVALNLGFERNADATPTILNDSLTEALIIFLQDESKRLDLLAKYAKELATTDLRTKQLKETKDVVYSLRETDKTSDQALDFLQEKLTILQEERDEHDRNLVAIISSVESIQTPLFLKEKVTEFVQNFTFVDTDSWEEELDYFRTRFLLQREQEEEDQRLKDEFLPKTSSSNTATPAKVISENDYFFIAVHKKYFTKLKYLIQEYNKIQLVQYTDSSVSLEEKSEKELHELIAKQEKVSFTVGREMYTLKREQGILTLKTYELVQTLKSRLLNITGSIASRRFMQDALDELYKLAFKSDLSFEDLRVTILKDLKRLLRIVRKEPAEGK